MIFDFFTSSNMYLGSILCSLYENLKVVKDSKEKKVLYRVSH